MTLSKIKKIGTLSPNTADSGEIAARAKHVNPIIDVVNAMNDGTSVVSFSGATMTSTSTITTVMPVTAPGAGFDTAGGVKFATYGKMGTNGMYVTDIYVNLKTAAVFKFT